MAIHRREWMGKWAPTQRQCQTTTRRELRCPNVAKYVLTWGERSADVCDECMPAWLDTFTKRGPVTVERVSQNGSQREGTRDKDEAGYEHEEDRPPQPRDAVEGANWTVA